MSRDTAADLASILAASGLGLSLGTNLFLGPVIEADENTVPDTSCFILQTGGDPPVPYIGGGRKSYRAITCQVRIRSARENFKAGQALALGALDSLHLATASPYTQILAEEGSPTYFGTDGSDRHWWTFTVSAEYLDTGTGGASFALAGTGEPKTPDVGALVAELLARVTALEARLAAAGL